MAQKDRVRDAAERLPDPEAPAPVDEIEEAANKLLVWIGSLDPAWADRINILRVERGFGAKEAAASLIAWPLDNALHMSVTQNPIIQNAMAGNTSGKMLCAQCGVEFKPSYGGQRPLCSNKCANAFDASGRAMSAAG